MKFKNFFTFFYIVTLSFMLSGCDTIADFVKTFSNAQESSEKSEPLEAPSYEKTLLVDILENQKVLIEEMQYASEYGDKSAIKELYEEFLQLDKSFQEEFEKNEGMLSNKEGWEISKLHQHIVKSLPTYSSLMSR